MYTDRQQHIVENLAISGWSQDQIDYELPAIERIVDDLEGHSPSRYNRNNLPSDKSYLSYAAGNRPGVANALLDNLSQRVLGELHNVEQIKTQRPIDVARAIAIAADSIRENRYMWEGMGFMQSYYGNNRANEPSDVLENRYALAARMVNDYITTHGGFPTPLIDNTNGPLCDVCANKFQDFSDFIDMFREWIDTLEPFMELISQYIDRTMNAPTQRIKTSRIFTPDGDKTDITTLDLSHFNQITSDSLTTFSSHKVIAALALENDELTMTEQYIEETKRYIDVFVVDQSGSMSGTPILKAAAFLWNRLSKVEDGFAMCAIIEFDTAARLYNLPMSLAGKDKPLWLIDTPEKARWAKKNIVKRYAQFVGGGTDIPAGVRKGGEIAKKMEEYGGVLPNITVVTDDDGSIAEMSPTELNIPINGLAVANNTSLQNFAISSGGGYNNLEEIEINIANILKG